MLFKTTQRIVSNSVVQVTSYLSLADAVEKVSSSVVYVEAYGMSNEYYSYTYGCTYGFDDEKLWSGSGVLISEDGFILTAAHVVKGASKFKVTLPDGQEFWSEDSWHRSDISDVGFIQLADVSDKLPVSCLGNIDGLRKGDGVLVIGCPFGDVLRFTVTKGIVSGFGRDFDGFFGAKVLMQVDAQSWPGNSGGPVYNLQGKIIGILVGGYYGADGISLCVPVDVISGILGIYEAEQAVQEL
jgi:serine protease Do